MPHEEPTSENLEFSLTSELANKFKLQRGGRLTFDRSSPQDVRLISAEWIEFYAVSGDCAFRRDQRLDGIKLDFSPSAGDCRPYAGNLDLRRATTQTLPGHKRARAGQECSPHQAAPRGNEAWTAVVSTGNRAATVRRCEEIFRTPKRAGENACPT